MFKEYDNFGGYNHSTEIQSDIVIRGTSANNNTIIQHKGDIVNNTINLHFHISALTQEEAKTTVGRIVAAIHKTLKKEKIYDYEQIPDVSTLQKRD